jgi:hypothetical protein
MDHPYGPWAKPITAGTPRAIYGPIGEAVLGPTFMPVRTGEHDMFVSRPVMHSALC